MTRPSGASPIIRSLGIARATRFAALGALLLAFLLTVGGADARAQAGRGDSAAFTVRDVQVDRTAVSAAAARETALVDGERAALRRLFERLVPQAQHGRLPKLSDSRIGDLVQNYEVQSERTSAVRYIATLTFRFKPDDVRTLLRNAGLPFAETYAKPYLVLPVLRQQGVTLLWDTPNPWRDAWNKLPPSDGLVPLVLPKGDLADTSDINADQAHNGDEQRLAAIARRYGVAGVYVADAELDASAAGRASLQVSLIAYGGASEQTLVDSFAQNPGEEMDAFLQRAALAMTDEVEERWKSAQLLQFDHEATLSVLVNYDDLSQWVAIRRRLGELAVIRRTDVVSFTRQQAVLNIVYIGDDGQLRTALAQQDLELVPAPGAPAANMTGAASVAPAASDSAAAPAWQLTMTGTGSAALPHP